MLSLFIKTIFNPDIKIWKKDCFFLKIDLSGYFMYCVFLHMDKKIREKIRDKF